MLAEAHIAQLIFLEVAFYPKALSDQSEHRPGRADEIADLQLINLGDNACMGRPHSGITKIEQRTIQRCLCPLHLRMLFSGCIDMARYCSPDPPALLSPRLDGLSCCLDGQHRLLIMGTGRHSPTQPFLSL